MSSYIYCLYNDVQWLPMVVLIYECPLIEICRILYMYVWVYRSHLENGHGGHGEFLVSAGRRPSEETAEKFAQFDA